MSAPRPLPDPLASPAVWRGRELLARRDWCVELAAADIDELSHAAEATAHSPIDDITAGAFALPTLGPRLRQIQQSLETGSGATLLRGFPSERFDEAQATRIFWGLAQHIGTPLSQSAAGERVFHVRDEGYQPHDPRARGPNTRKRLSFHTDRCDVIAFLCLRQALSGGENDLVSSAALFNEVRRRRPDLLAELMQPYYYQRHNVDLGNARPYCRQPIFSFCQGHFAGSFLRVLIERAYASAEVPEMTAVQREALDFLEAVADEPGMHVRIRQQPGDMLLLNNWVTFHRRTEFEDFAAPEERRHILRIWLSVPNSRPLDPAFQDNYGATAAGALRGGMQARST
ncbi:MAG: TauD/TfdA family dioxygenase [Planctomycetales bacterium]|nr:TauD/TfdA family dioxygenase [Planctomycetales bacterium]